jgi:bifunctional polynucleotide phosphatase/kinase
LRNEKNAFQFQLLSKAEGVIGRIRNVVKEGRTPKINEYILTREKKVLVLDMDTRWGSIYMMVDRLIEVKSSVQELAGIGNKNLFLTNAQWEQAEELRDILQKAFEVTKKLQFDNITPGYFYKKWSGLRLCYENNDSLLATEIAKAMKKREADLLDNGLLLAAVSLDVNSMDMLPVDSADKAMQTITSLALRIQGLEEDDPKQTITDDDDDDAMSSSSEDSATDSDEEMRVLRKKQRRTCASFSFSRSVEVAAGRAGNGNNTKGPDVTVKQKTITGVKAAIDKLMNQRMTLKKTKKDLVTLINEDYPEELKELALLLCTMPVTQVSVERLFSALKIFKRDERSRLKEDILNALLLLKANSLDG